MLKRLNFIISSIIPPKLYWHLAGLIRPWDSVVEGINKPAALYKESEGLVKLLKKLKLINKNSQVLDIGCGVGRLEYKLAKEVKSCTGIDIAPSMIALSKKYIKAKNVEFIIVNGKDLQKLKGRQFSLIFSIIVFQHLSKDTFKNYVKESYQYLQKGGKLFFQIPIFTDQKPPEVPNNHPWAIRRYNLHELKNILKISGFKNTNFSTVSGGKLTGKENQIFVLGEKN